MNNDLISREYITGKICGLYSDGEKANNKDKVINEIIDIIDNAPTVPNEYMRGYEAAEREYKRPQGEWLKNCENCDCNHCYESGHRFTRKDCSGTCSVCGVYSCCTDNYCPNCGASMRKGGAE